VVVLAATSCGKNVVGPDPITTDPPRITCPALPPETLTSGQSMVLTYLPTVANGEPPVTITCTPASGSTFSIGTTPVSCSATDARQRTSSCAFNIVVQPPPRLMLTRFLAFGDSITAGEDGNTTLTSFSLEHFLRVYYPTFILRGREYPTVLQGLLAARYTTQQPTVDNRGVSGEYAAAATTLTRFVERVASRSYDAALLMEGANDILGGTGGNPLGVAPTIANFRRMIAEARSRGVRVFLATIPPANPADARGATRYQVVPMLNAEIRALAVAEGVPMVDVFDAFNGDFSLLSVDGLHPNAEGFARIASKFYDVIRQDLEEAPRTMMLTRDVPLVGVVSSEGR
jgi:lysophospholipase L1-like esterase